MIVFGVPYDPETYFAPSGVGKTFFWIFALLPWCPLSKGTQDLASATNSDKSPGEPTALRKGLCVRGAAGYTGALCNKAGDHDRMLRVAVHDNSVHWLIQPV